MLRVTILDGHPNPESFCRALADRYAEGAGRAGHEVRRLNVRDLEFAPNLTRGYREVIALEPDLQRAQEDIEWCQHFVLVHPIWWGGMPALLKGFFDRTFLPGWAFRYHKDDPFWDRLLEGRSARLIVTSDAPVLYNWIANANAPVTVTKKMVLQFCGFKPVRVLPVGMVKKLTPEQRENVLEQVGRLGEKGK